MLKRQVTSMEHELEKAREEQLAAVRALESSKVLSLLYIYIYCIIYIIYI